MMNSPQLENGYTKIANEIIDQFCKYRISGEEWLVLWVIIRKTYGFNKKMDTISLTQFSQITGMKRQSVFRALKSLSAKKLILVSKKAYKDIVSYGIIKDYGNWIPVSKKAYSKQKRLPTVSKNASPISAKMLPTKDNIQKTNKNTLLKDGIKTPSHTQDCLKYFYASYKTVLGSEYVANFAKDGSLFKSMLRVLPPEVIKSRIDTFFKSEDKFIQEAGYTTGVFASQINKLIRSEGSELNRIRAQFGLKKE